MKALRHAFDIHGQEVDRDTRRARLIAARRKPIGSVNRAAILGGYRDGGNVVGAFRNGRGSFIVDAA